MERERIRQQAEAEKRVQEQVAINRSTAINAQPPIRPPVATQSTTKGEGAPILNVNPEKKIREFLGVT